MLVVRVLILVLMEDGLGPMLMMAATGIKKGLNPCFNGRWSRTAHK